MKEENILTKLSGFCRKFGELNGYRGHRIIVNGYQEPKRVEFFTGTKSSAFSVILSVPFLKTVNVKVKETTNLQIELKGSEIIITGGTK